MNLYMPTHVINETNCVINHAAKLCSLGTKALIVTGKYSSKKNGSLNDIQTALDSHSIPYIIYDSIEENPSLETVIEASNIGKENHADFVIGVGGGSPLDASKAIAILIANPEKSDEILYQAEKFAHLPVACVPTTAGTGSEVTPYSILTLHKEKTKKGISQRVFPTYAFTDSSYLKTSSQSGLINTAVDTLAHLVESYLNTSSNIYNRIYSEKGLLLWGQIKENLAKNNCTDEMYDTLMTASTLGGIAISHTGTSLPHGLSYDITYNLNVPHGKAVGFFLGGYVDIYENKDDVENVLSLLGFTSVEEFKTYLADLLKLDELEVSSDLLESTMQSLLNNQAKLSAYPYQLYINQLKQIPYQH